MNSDGHLVDTEDFNEQQRQNLIEDGYVQVEKSLETPAELELAGRAETMVGKHASGSMGKHLRYLRKKKAQALQAQRRKNRSYSV